MTAIPAGKYFISYAYEDEPRRHELLQLLPAGVDARVFPPVKVKTPDFVSNHLIDAMLHTDGVISLVAPASEQSFWVAFERDYARRAGLPLYLVDTRRRMLQRDNRPALSLRARPIYSLADSRLVERIIAYLRQERSFDVWPQDPPEIVAAPARSGVTTVSLAMHRDRNDPLACAVLFWSAATAGSDISGILSGQSRRPLIVAVIEPGLPRPAGISRDAIVDLVANGEFDTRRLDDVMVRLCWAALTGGR